ncbi:MAG: hypothetical protein WD646_11680 [Actinomycetota bacterium]
MSMLQLKNVPEPTKRSLRKRAREAGMTMSDYVLRLIERDLQRPTPDELLRRLSELTPHDDWPSGAELLEEARREREEELGW